MENMEVNHVEELNHLLSLAKHPQTIALLQGGLEAARVPNGKPETTVKDTVQVTMKPTRTHMDKPIPKKITSYGWDQSDKFVKIYISDIPEMNQLKPDNIQSNYLEREMDVTIRTPKGSYSLVINDLLMSIQPDMSSAKLKSGMVIVSLKKVEPEKWSVLTGREKKLKDARESKPLKPEDNTEDPGAGLMKMMQKMYDDGDDDMKRTIRKAWHESQDKKAKGEF